MAEYRKKPVVVEAMRYEGLPMTEELLAFVCGHYDVAPNTNLVVFTLHGATQATVGDWIIRGPDGDYWPCKPDIFKASYEPV